MARPKKEAKDLTDVTLISTDVLTPYAAGEVFTVPQYVADLLLDPTKVDADGNVMPVKVQVFDPSNTDHAEALVAQRGKTVDVEPEPAAA